jgi:PTS system nitrogen regulatory IIA component
MNLVTFLKPDTVALRLQVRDKVDLLNQMVDLLPLHAETEELAEELRERVRTTIHQREEQDSTGIGDGLAFPHARVPGLQTTLVSLATLATPLDFDSLDGEPIELACMVIVPAEAPTVFLKIMSQLVQFLGNADDRQALHAADSTAAVLDLLRAADLSVDVPIYARDVMQPSRVPIYPDTPLVKVTDDMLEHQLNAVAVIDRDGKLLGEVTCDLLFRYGLPDFLARLKSVSFISEFDPFEKYFEREASSTASDVMNTEPPVMPADATMLEIVFALAVQKHLNVYIVDSDNHVVGVVDRISVLDKILNL